MFWWAVQLKWGTILSDLTARDNLVGLVLQVLLWWYCQFAAMANSGTTCKAARVATMSGTQLRHLFVAAQEKLCMGCAKFRTPGEETGWHAGNLCGKLKDVHVAIWTGTRLKVDAAGEFWNSLTSGWNRSTSIAARQQGGGGIEGEGDL